MLPTATDVARSVVCLSVCLSVSGTDMVCAKTAEPIEMLFAGLAHVSPRNDALDTVKISHGNMQFLGLFGPLNCIEFLLRCTQQKGSCVDGPVIIIEVKHHCDE